MDHIKISVIVPAYNVENYVRECLDSLLKQSIINVMEIIMINDCSTDTTGQIMDEYARNHTNFHVHHKEKGGPGQARNYGMKFAQGKYIAFVDSDDCVSEKGYEKMLFLAEKNDTEIVIGNVMRFNSTQMSPSKLHQYIFFENKDHTHIFEFPELVYDTSPCNKIIKKSFWERNKISFPENVLYEDIPPMIIAHVLASAISVINEPIYYWRIRDEGEKSITQQTSEMKNLLDRIKAINMVYDYFSLHWIPISVKREFDYKNLSHDLKIYMNTLPDSDEQYQRELMESIQPILNRMDDIVFQRLSFIDRQRYKYVKNMNMRKLNCMQKLARVKYNLKKMIKK